MLNQTKPIKVMKRISYFLMFAFFCALFSCSAPAEKKVEKVEEATEEIVAEQDSVELEEVEEAE